MNMQNTVRVKMCIANAANVVHLQILQTLPHPRFGSTDPYQVVTQDLSLPNQIERFYSF